MNELLMIFIPSMIVFYLADYNSKYELGTWGEKIYIRHNKTFFVIATITMAVFVGMRNWYNDTVTYIGSYEAISIENSVFYNMKWSIGDNPGFFMLNRILKHIGFSAQSFLLFYAVITICIYLCFVRKYTDNLWMSVFFFYTMGCYTFTMAAMKQTVAIAFCLIAIDKAIQKKWHWFVIWLFIAWTFHPYALIYLVTPILMFKPWSAKTYWMLGICAAIGVSLQLLMNVIVGITAMMGKDEYDVSTFTGAGVNIFRLTVVWAPILLSFLARKQLYTNEDRASNLIMNLSIINAEIMFIALFGTANYFARLANYFLIFQTISLPMLFRYFTKESQKLLYGVVIVSYLLYFYYANVISQPFDYQFNQTNFFSYLSSLF